MRLQGFNTQPPEGGWTPSLAAYPAPCAVSTHSRPKAAGWRQRRQRPQRGVSTHSRPKAAGPTSDIPSGRNRVSTHSRPKAAGFLRSANQLKQSMFQHTAARRRLDPTISQKRMTSLRFQHTAARRRLANAINSMPADLLFQHTAARRRLEHLSKINLFQSSFNTQPPEGGWQLFYISGGGTVLFQHTAARRRLAKNRYLQKLINLFQHTAARRRLVPYGYPLTHGQSFNTQPPEGGWDRPDNPCCTLCGFNTQPPEGGWPYAC